MQRNQSLDALRGFAILTMVLSGSIAFGGLLPAWMYHAQLPPPLHKFDPSIPGITWVDLVFPFFLFSMGAAIPLSLAKHVKERIPFIQIVIIAARRFALLTFFALFTFHMRAWVLATSPSAIHYLFSIAAFALLFFQFYDTKEERYKPLFIVSKIVAFLLALYMLYFLSFSGKPFSLDKSDIIILVLGNMAFFGTITWWLTRKKPMIRLGILPFVMAVFLGSKQVGSWNEALFSFSPVPWMYKFYYLKYLFIILPGTLAGEWLLTAASSRSNETISGDYNKGMIGILSFLLIGLNVSFLFGRYLVLNLAITIVLLFVIFYLLNKTNKRENILLYRFFRAGVYMLLLGLFFEAWESGIKKDSSTYSYYFVTGGLSFFMLIGFYYSQLFRWSKSITLYLSLNGRNPMVAYVAGNLLLTPILHLSGAITLFNQMNTNPWIGLLKGVLFTGIVSLITIYFTKRQWYWKA